MITGVLGMGNVGIDVLFSESVNQQCSFPPFLKLGEL